MADPGTSIHTASQGEGLHIDHELVEPQEHPLDPTTFIAPAPLPAPSVIVEFCDRVSKFHRRTVGERN